jgi:hypothetical protein
MKHLIKKNLFQGGGKSKPKPTPAILKPPKLDNYEILNSYSVAEIVDLISDGPIEGLVNQNGQTLGKQASILQGVYLDNTPIQQTSVYFPINASDVIGSLEISSSLNVLGDIYYSDNSYKTYFHKPFVVLNGLNLTTKIPERRLLATQTKQGVANAKDEYYSPIVDDILVDGISKNGWELKGNTKNVKPISGPIYFENSASKLEVHYIDPNQSLFASDTLLPKTLLSKLETSLKELSGDSPDQEKFFNNQVLKKIQELKGKASKEKFNWNSKNTVYIVVEIADKNNPKELNDGAVATKSIFDSKGVFKTVSFELENFSRNIPQNQIYKLLVPTVDTDNQYTNKVYGCLVIAIPTTYRSTKGNVQNFGANSSVNSYDYYYNRQFISDLSGFITENTKLIFKIGEESSYQNKAAKYNFLNISCELKNGQEYQDPLEYFKNIYVDHDYTTPLSGPFIAGYETRRIDGNWKTNGFGPQNPKLNLSLNEQEGSNDLRAATVGNAQQSYSEWNNDNEYDEDAIAITHTIENPEVSSVFFTLAISNLSDTVAKSTSDQRELGDKVPAIVEIEVEWGKISNGEISNAKTKKYAVIAMVEGQMLIDFGSPDLESIENDYFKAVRDVSNISKSTFDQAVLSKPFILPKLTNQENPSSVKRYIKVKKLSTETNSVLLKKEIALYKVTEIIEQNLSYPFSAIAGIKIDARTFGSVPERTYDCRLKLVNVPMNYYPLSADRSDNRYIKSASQYTSPNLVYDGDWDGQFKMEWTDNPAWIIYDLLTSKRYGLGAYIDESQINKWELYKIGRFCDAVDSNGYFQGVSDGIGGLEPRYSCNILFKDQTKIFDAINIVASLFRGSVFFSNSEIHFLDDRPKEPIALFTNSNVKDGVFNYINNRRDLQFNTVEVVYLDRFDNYQTKIEYVQDEADIRKRGVFKTDINTLGVTSRAMARRIGQHLIYQTIKENQSIEFSAGLDSLLCRPGDLVIVEDEMKTMSTNYGRILEKNIAEKTLRIDNFYDSGSFTGRVTVYTPTGYTTNEELNDIAILNRNRVPYFDVLTGLIEPSDDVLTGRYYFSGYVGGYPTGYPNIGNPFPTQFPLYTGSGYSGHSLFCYYNTGYTGFVFATGLPYQDNDTFDKVITNTGISDITYFDTGVDSTGFRYSSASSTKRTAPSGNVADRIDVPFDSYHGILESEINTINNPQITTFNVTGHDSNYAYGSELFLDQNDININLLQFVGEGSVYRIERKNASDQIYKIISIREQNQNEYSVSASKYDTGKFQEIENHITSDFLPQTYANSVAQAAIGINKLAAPVITLFNTGTFGTTFSLTGTWSGVANATGYTAQIINNDSSDTYRQTSSSLNFGVTGLIYGGRWLLNVQALGNNTTYTSSDIATSGKLILNTPIPSTPYDRAFITNFNVK